MDEFTFVIKLQRAIKAHLAALSINVTSGGVDNFDKYKYITGQISALESVLQEISNLLQKKEQKQDEGNVIRIDKEPGPKDPGRS
jgi:ethanolamine utilization microcompartment shell protein EutS